MYIAFFFFKQKTAYELRISDWSSGVCSSDLPGDQGEGALRRQVHELAMPGRAVHGGEQRVERLASLARSVAASGVGEAVEHAPGVLLKDHRGDRKSTRLNSSP